LHRFIDNDSQIHVAYVLPGGENPNRGPATDGITNPEAHMVAPDGTDLNSETGNRPGGKALVRLACSAIAVVDLWDRCGETQHLHMGALSLRVFEAVLQEFVATFGQAISALATYRWPRELESLLESPNTHRVGEA
jgi:hypothetical protein